MFLQLNRFLIDMRKYDNTDECQKKEFDKKIELIYVLPTH